MRQYGWFVAAAVLAAAGFMAPEGWDMVLWLSGALFACSGVIVRDARKGALATAALAVFSNGYLLSRKLESAVGHSRCNINELLNCDVVNGSAASEMFGLPITLFGVAFYLALAIAASLHPRNTPRFNQVSGLFALVNLGYSAWLAWQSTQLGAVCVVCISIYIANILLFWAAMRGLAEEKKKLFDDLAGAPTSWTSLILASVFGMVVLVGAGQWRSQTSTEARLSGGGETLDPNNADMLAQLYGSPRGPVTIDGSEPLLGSPDARYQLVEFADFGCPHCARASLEVASLVHESPDFNVRFKVFPLTAACNPGIERDTGNERCRAAHAAECGNRQGKFWKYAHLIFANQTMLDDESLKFMADQSGLDMSAWTECMNDDTVMDGVRADAMAGLRAGVAGTPSFFLEGTHGPDEYIEVYAGVPAAYTLVEAQKNGVSLLAPGPPREP